MSETGSIEAICEDLCSSDATSIVEEELEVTSVTGSVGVCDGFGVAERVEERAKCTDLIGKFRLPFGVRRESEELVYEEAGAEALSGTGDPPYVHNVSAKTRCKTNQGHGADAPEDNRLRLIPTPHDEVHFCGQLIEMGGRWNRSAGQ